MMGINEYNDQNVGINLAAMKRLRFYHMCDPNSTHIFGYNVYWLFCVIFCVFTQTLVSFGTAGLFVKMEDSLLLGGIDVLINFLVFINFYICLWKMTVMLYNKNKIWDVINVSRLNFFTSKYCTRHIKILNECRSRTIKITNIYNLFTFIMSIQWIVYPLIVLSFKIHNKDDRIMNIFDLQYPFVTLKTYNQYFAVFYVIEIIITLFLMYTTTLADTFVMCFCWIIMAQYKTLSRAFENIRNEDICQIDNKNNFSKNYKEFKSVLFDQLQLYLKLKLYYSIVWPMILVYVALISIGITTATYSLIKVCTSPELFSLMSVFKLATIFVFYCSELYLYCYLFDNLNLQKESINFAIYSGNWTTADLKFKKLLLLSMQMNNTHQLMLKASPTKIINLQLFANVITTSYNVVSVMLKTMNKKEYY